MEKSCCCHPVTSNGSSASWDQSVWIDFEIPGGTKELLDEGFDTPGGSGLAPNESPLGDLRLELQGCQLNLDIVS